MKKASFFFIIAAILAMGSPYPAQNYYNVRLGEISRVDKVTGLVEVSIYNPRFEFELKNGNVQILMVLEENSIDKKELVVKSFRTIANVIYVDCFPKMKGQHFFTGQPVGIQRTVKQEPVLQDKITPEKKVSRTIISPADSSQMVLIPDGPFIFGSDIPGTDSYTTPIEYEQTEVQKEMGKKRVRYLHLNAFYIDKYEITVGQFSRFLRDTATVQPPTWNRESDPELPVSGLSFTMAESYCKWAGKRLPSELEWEKASRGPGLYSGYTENDTIFYNEKPNVYPTGLEFDEDKCVTADTIAKPQSVFNLKDKNYYGLYGMCGNAAEWTSSWYLPYRGNTSRNTSFGRKFKVIRGGAYNLPSRWTRVYERMIGGLPTLNSDYRAGVRCAMDP